jgi:hypothetical protein
MSLAFIGFSKDAKPTQIRTAGLWNIAVALDRLSEELAYARTESAKPPAILTAELSDSRDYLFSLRSGVNVCGRPAAITRDWVVIKKADGIRACVAVDCIESIAEKVLDGPANGGVK